MWLRRRVEEKAGKLAERTEPGQMIECPYVNHCYKDAERHRRSETYAENGTGIEGIMYKITR